MRVYLRPPQESRGLWRIHDALFSGVPDGWLPTPNEDEADLVILYAIGRCNAITAKAKAIKASGRKYAVIQVCLRSTLNPDTRDWIPLWEGATALWSYYDLFKAALDDGVYIQGMDNFYHAPLGADAEVFWPRPLVPEGVKDWIVLSSGLSRLSESVRECHLAAAEVDRLSIHLGADLNLPNDAHCYTNRTDDQLAWIYSQCEFVSGLRRKEGFELPAVEGLLCGARPIVFNTEDYRWCYGNHAIYIEETDRQGVIDQLVQLFKHGAPPVTEEERQRAVERYNWETIVGGFYERLI